MRSVMVVGMALGLAVLTAVPANAGLFGLPSVLNLPGVLLLGYDEVSWYTEPNSCFPLAGILGSLDGSSSTDPNAVALVEVDFAAGTVDIEATSAFPLPWLVGFLTCGQKSDAFVGCTVTVGAAPGGAGQTIECGNALVRDDPNVFDSYLAIHDRGDGSGWLYYQVNELHPDSDGAAYLVHRISGEIAL